MRPIHVNRLVLPASGANNPPRCRPGTNDDLESLTFRNRMRNNEFPRLPPLDLLVAFEAAARHLSFTRAGAERFVTQSAMSRQIRALEDELGVPLFQRGHRA